MASARCTWTRRRAGWTWAARPDPARRSPRVIDKQVSTAAAAVADIPDGASIAVGGFGSATP